MIVRSLGVSHRRALLDAELVPLAGAMRGRVVEIGVRRAGRGRFAPESAAACWVRIDIDPRHRPDVIGDVMRLPLGDEVADWVVCLEMLQYVVTPEAAIAEIARVLVRHGRTIVSVPFLHRADTPTDRHRFTETRLRELLAHGGLHLERLAAQGHFFGTLAHQVRQAAAQARARPLRWALGAVVVPLGAVLGAADRLGAVRRSPFLSSFTTGFVAVARKD